MESAGRQEQKGLSAVVAAIGLLFGATTVFANPLDGEGLRTPGGITIDDARKTQVLEGNVQLTQGTLVIRAEKIIVVQDANGFNKGTAFAANHKLATFRQKREGKDEYIEGEAERIEYDGRADKVELFNRAYVKSGHDEVRGRYIAYDGKTENYVAASSSPAGDKGSGSERVHAVIQPKNKDVGGQ